VCSAVGRDPKAIERTLNIYGNPAPAIYDDMSELSSAHHLNIGAPWDMTPVEHWCDAGAHMTNDGHGRAFGKLKQRNRYNPGRAALR